MIFVWLDDYKVIKFSLNNSLSRIEEKEEKSKLGQQPMSKFTIEANFLKGFESRHV